MHAPNFKTWPCKSTQVNANWQNQNLRGSFASYYTNSGALIINYSTSGIVRDTHKKRAPESPRGVQRGEKRRKERMNEMNEPLQKVRLAANIFIKAYFSAHFILGNL